jgi:predicted metalloendopeptidase
VKGLRLVVVLLLAAGAILAAAPAQRPALGVGRWSDRDPAVPPQDDFFRHVNDRWIATTPITDHRVVMDAAAEVADLVASRIDVLLRRLGETRLASGSPERQAVDLYRSMIDQGTVEARGLAPLESDLRVINNIDSARSLATGIGRISATTRAGPFASRILTDPAKPGARVVWLAQGGLLLDRELYLDDDERSRRLRDGYRRYLARIFGVLEGGRAAEEADAVFELETALARAHQEDTVGRVMTLEQMHREMPGFDWTAWARPLGFDRAAAIHVTAPEFFRAFAARVPGTPLSTWRAWLRGRYLTAVAHQSTAELSDARFDFFGRQLIGQRAPIPLWQRAVSLVNGTVGDTVGRLYVDAFLSDGVRTRVERLAAEVVRAARTAVAEAAWMTPATRDEADRKLATLVVRVGRPDEWRDYRGLRIEPDDLFGNIERGYAFDNARRLARADGRNRAGEWPMSPQTTTVVYVPASNEILIPAGILLPPFFDPAADDAENLGAIGAIVGHEIAHAIDLSGRQIDAAGASRDWWTSEDDTAYRSMAGALAEQLTTFAETERITLDGRRVLAEGLSDLSGLSLAFRAYRSAHGGAQAPVITGVTGDQRFFIAWARLWRSHVRPEYLIQLLASSSHPPAAFRVNAIVPNFAAFHEAFGVREGDRLFVPPARRIRIF